MSDLVQTSMAAPTTGNPKRDAVHARDIGALKPDQLGVDLLLPRPERSSTHLASPVPQQASADLISAGNLGDACAGLLGLSDNPQLLPRAPTPSSFNASDDLHPADCP